MLTRSFRSKKTIKEIKEDLNQIKHSRIRGWIRNRKKYRDGCIQSMSRIENDLISIFPDSIPGPHENHFIFPRLRQIKSKRFERIGFGNKNSRKGDGVFFAHFHNPDSRGHLKGHAISVDEPEAPVQLSIIIDGEKIADIIADNFAWDVLTAGHPTGLGAFDFRIPDRFLDGSRHEIELHILGAANPFGRHYGKLSMPLLIKSRKPWIASRDELTHGRQEIMRGDLSRGRELVRQAVESNPEAIFTDFGFTERNAEGKKINPIFRERLGDRAHVWHSAQECGVANCCKQQGLDIRNIYEKALKHFNTIDPREVRKNCHHWPRYFASKLFIKEYGNTFSLKSPKTIATLSSLEGVSRSELPRRCVIKPEASSGIGLYLMHDDVNLFNGLETPWEQIVSETKEIGQRNEKIIVEEFLVQEGCEESDPIIPLDYKLHVFGGKVRLIHVDDRNHLSRDRLRRQQGWFSRNWVPTPLRFRVSEVEQPGLVPPHQYEEIIRIGDEIGADIGDYIRVDLYATNAGVYLGEVTHTTHNGVGFTEFGDMVMRQLWDLYDNPMEQPAPVWS